MGSLQLLPFTDSCKEERYVEPMCSSLLILLFLLVVEEALQYLRKYGYLSDVAASPSPGGATSQPHQAFENLAEAVRLLQRFGGLPETGVVDGETEELMARPRCGVKDLNHQTRRDGNNTKRLGQYQLQGSKWHKKQLSWRVLQSSSKMTPKSVLVEVRKAFAFWSQVADLEFVESSLGDVDLEVSYATYSHGDGDPFDGPGGTLAHAFYPRWGGDIHMDDSEDWTVGDDRGTNMLATLTHEIGHSLGLEHSAVPGAVMTPFSSPYDPSFSLSQDDIDGVVALYGPAKPKSPYPPIPSLTCPMPNSNTQGREGASVIEGIQSWADCSLKCKDTSGCRYWTWHHEGAGEYAFRCVVMDDILNTATDSNAVSGTVRCVCPMMETNLQGREGSKKLGYVDSWHLCSQLCSQDKDCNHWIWHPVGEHEASRRCVGVEGFDNTAPDLLAVSGAKGCS